MAGEVGMSSIWDFPSPPLPMKGRVWSGVFFSIAHKGHAGEGKS
jgi:hypothetical protein